MNRICKCCLVSIPSMIAGATVLYLLLPDEAKESAKKKLKKAVKEKEDAVINLMKKKEQVMLDAID